MPNKLKKPSKRTKRSSRFSIATISACEKSFLKNISTSELRKTIKKFDAENPQSSFHGEVDEAERETLEQFFLEKNIVFLDGDYWDMVCSTMPLGLPEDSLLE